MANNKASELGDSAALEYEAVRIILSTEGL